VDEPRDLAEHAQAGPGDHVLPLEPEVEEVAVDDQGPGFARHRPQQADQRMFGVGRRDAEVGVGEQVHRAGKHRRILARAAALYKGPRAPIDSRRWRVAPKSVSAMPSPTRWAWPTTPIISSGARSAARTSSASSG